MASKRSSSRLRNKSGQASAFPSISWDDFDDFESDDKEDQIHSAQCLNTKSKRNSKTDKIVKTNKATIGFKKPAVGKCTKVKTPSKRLSSSQSRITDLLRGKSGGTLNPIKSSEPCTGKHRGNLRRSATLSDLSDINNCNTLSDVGNQLKKSQVSVNSCTNNSYLVKRSDSCDSFTSAISSQDVVESVNNCLKEPEVFDMTDETLSLQAIPISKAHESDSNGQTTTQSSINMDVIVAATQNSENLTTSEMDRVLDSRLAAFETSMANKIASSIASAMETFKQDLRQDFADLKNDLSTEKQTFMTEVNDRITKVSGDVTSANGKVNGCVVQVKDLQDVVIRQDQIIHECVARIDKLEKRSMNSNILIKGLVKKKDVSWRTTVGKFFMEILKVGEINILDAFKIGKYPNSPVLVTLTDGKDKSKIFAKAKDLGDVVNEFDKPYRIDEQLPPAIREKKLRSRQLMAINKGKDSNDQLTMERKNGELFVNNTKYEKLVEPPSVRQILKASKEERIKRNEFDTVLGKAMDVDGSRFLGYSAIVSDIKQVNLAYAKIKAAHIDARSVLCAFRIPNTDYHTHQDYVDDNEHGAGRMLLNAMVRSKIQHRAIFVVRYFSGEHIGPARFQAIMDVAKDAVVKLTFNKLTGEHDMLWTGETNTNAGGNRDRPARRPRGGSHGTPRNQHKTTRASDTPLSPSYADIAAGLPT